MPFFHLFPIYLYKGISEVYQPFISIFDLMDSVYTFKRVEMSYLITVEKSFPIKQNVLPKNFFWFLYKISVLTFIFRPGSFSISCLAKSLHDFLEAGGTLESSSQYLEGACP